MVICNDHMVHIINNIILKLFTFVLGAINFVLDAINAKYSIGIHNRILIRRMMFLLERLSFFTPLFVDGLFFRLLWFNLIEVIIQRSHSFLLGLGNIALAESVEHIVYKFRTGGDGDLAIAVHLFFIIGNDSRGVASQKKVCHSVEKSFYAVFGAIRFLVVIAQPMRSAVIAPLFTEFIYNLASFLIVIDADLINVCGWED